ncbi:MAG: hypothetical protein WBA77_19980 [Microcoleaceae cyanobacterium]
MIIHKNYIRPLYPIIRLPLLLIGLLYFSLIQTTSALAQSQRYGVYVESDSPLLLEIVQQIQPGAILRRYGRRTIIEAGVYFNEAEAEFLANALAVRGVEAEITDFSDGVQFGGSGRFIPVVLPIPRGEIAAVETNIPSIRRPVEEEFLSLYLVVVSIDNTVVSEVNKVSLDAVIQEYNDKLFIQAGSFLNIENAAYLVDELALRGIEANVIETQAELERWIATQPDIPETISAITEDANFGLATQESYFVLIPAAVIDLQPIAETAIALGVPENSIIIQDLADDPFVAVGPFTNETLAQEWESYFTQSGISGARVYFGR